MVYCIRGFGLWYREAIWSLHLKSIQPVNKRNFFKGRKALHVLLFWRGDSVAVYDVEGPTGIFVYSKDDTEKKRSPSRMRTNLVVNELLYDNVFFYKKKKLASWFVVCLWVLIGFLCILKWCDIVSWWKIFLSASYLRSGSLTFIKHIPCFFELRWKLELSALERKTSAQFCKKRRFE